MVVLEVAFWASLGLLAYTHVGYPLLLAVLSSVRGGRRDGPGEQGELPSVTLTVAAHNEEDSIAGWVANALALDYPREDLRVVVACDGCTDATAARAREAGADEVVELERGGKITALNTVAAASAADVLAFADANSRWEPGALRRLVAPFADERVGYVCGDVTFTAPDGSPNQEGLYWRYEMAVRRMESGLAGITAGNGAINAVRASAYVALDPGRGQDISFPFELAKRGLRAVYRAGRPGQRAHGADDRGRVPAQAPDDGRRLEHDPQHGAALAARLQPAVRAGDLLAPAAALRDPDPPPRGARHEHRPRGRGERVRDHADRPGRLPRRGAPRQGDPVRAASHRSLLRGGHGGQRRRALGPAAPRRAADLGERGGDEVRAAVGAVAAAIGLVLLSPVLLAAAVAIKLDSRGPVFYRQRRAGLNGEPFELWKLRTMTPGADPVGVGTPVLEGDPRVTRVGAFLRRFSLDELPNLINVVQGDLALVGPRPTLEAQVELYTPHQRRRLEVRPGITGWAQVNGRAGIPWEERIELDVWYVDHRSALLDLKILLRTARLLLTGHGLYG